MGSLPWILILKHDLAPHFSNKIILQKFTQKTRIAYWVLSKHLGSFILMQESLIIYWLLGNMAFHIRSQLNEFLYFTIILSLSLQLCQFSLCDVVLYPNFMKWVIQKYVQEVVPAQKQRGGVAESPTPSGIHWSLWQGGLQSAAAVVWNTRLKTVTYRSLKAVTHRISKAVTQDLPKKAATEHFSLQNNG